MSRPQIGIERLPVRRTSNEPKEAMNCKSCRKRKIKCNRLKPSCEACQVFNCACIYDAIPKKRGPKTDVLEALLKRVNGLEKRLKDENKSSSPVPEGVGESSATVADDVEEDSGDGRDEAINQQPTEVEAALPEEQHIDAQPMQPVIQSQSQNHTQSQEQTSYANALLDTYFSRLHGKPYYILDEPATRQRLRDGTIPRFLVNAIYAVAIRYAPHLCGGHAAAARYSQEYAIQSRAEIDVDEPSIEHLQALLLLTMTSFQSGRGKKCYMLLTHAVSMAFGLSLHRELPSQLRIAPSEREGRRKLFWTCYLMDRFTVSGSKRPSLISDESICLRMPAWLPPASHVWVDGSYFPNGSSVPYAQGIANAGQGSGAMLVEIVRVLGVTNRYLAAGGVKGDSHFPWHVQSTLSRIRSDLDCWAANTQDAFTSLDALFGQPDSSTLILSKLIYHLVHCLIYRPFLPVDLTELSGSGQHQSWQIEATNLCFLHANAIAELVEIGKSTSIIDWPSFVGYCICTAGTIHVHGAHYMTLREGDVFSNSADFLAHEMAQLHDLRSAWAGIQHQRETLQTVYSSHSQLVKSLSTSPMRFSPVFQMEDFFDRYPGSYIDGAHVTFSDVDLDLLHDNTFNGYTNGSLDPWTTASAPEFQISLQAMAPSQYMTQNHMPSVVRRPKRRRTATSSMPYPTPILEHAGVPPLDRHTSHDSAIPTLHHQQRTQQQPHFPRHDFLDTNGNVNGNGVPKDQPQMMCDPVHPDAAVESVFSPTFDFSTMPPAAEHRTHTNGDTANGQAHGNGTNGLHNNGSTVYGAQAFDHQTPGGFSQSGDSSYTDPTDKDPFLSLLEQLAQHDGSLEPGAPSELDFFLNGQG